MSMIIIRTIDSAAARKALGFLAGRFSLKTWATGESMVPDEALAPLALEGVSFAVEGLARYEHLIPSIAGKSPFKARRKKPSRRRAKSQELRAKSQEPY